MSKRTSTFYRVVTPTGEISLTPPQNSVIQHPIFPRERRSYYGNIPDGSKLRSSQNYQKIRSVMMDLESRLKEGPPVTPKSSKKQNNKFERILHIWERLSDQQQRESITLSELECLKKVVAEIKDSIMLKVDELINTQEQFMKKQVFLNNLRLSTNEMRTRRENSIGYFGYVNVWKLCSLLKKFLVALNAFHTADKEARTEIELFKTECKLYLDMLKKGVPPFKEADDNVPIVVTFLGFSDDSDQNESREIEVFTKQLNYTFTLLVSFIEGCLNTELTL